MLDIPGRRIHIAGMPSARSGDLTIDHLIFAAVALLVTALTIDIQGLIGAGDPKTSEQSMVIPAKRESWAHATPAARELLLKEHEAILAEIRLRIEEEHLLFALKFVLVGATLWAFLQYAFRKETSDFERTQFGALAAWSAVIAAAIVDLRTVTNQSFLSTLGGWNRQYEELLLGSSAVNLGWEAFLADNLLGQRYYPTLRISGQVLTALLFCFTGSLFLIRTNRDNDLATARVSGACAAVSVVLMTVAALSLRRTGVALATYLTVGLSAAILSLRLASASHANHKEGVAIQSPRAA